jgi:hypothetical protein
LVKQERKASRQENEGAARVSRVAGAAEAMLASATVKKMKDCIVAE